MTAESLSTMGTPIVMFHNVGAPSLFSRARGMTVFPWAIGQYARDLIARGYNLATLDAYARARELEGEPPRLAVFTFDDAYAGVHRYALPALERVVGKATVFVVTGQIGGHSVWMEGRDGRHRLMDWRQIEDAHRRGFEIGCHTHSHPHLTQISEVDARREIFDSKKILEDRLGAEVVSFAYPYGDFDDRIRDLVQEAGYSSAVTVRKGRSTLADHVLTLPRMPVISWRLSPRAFERLVEGRPSA